MPVIIKRYRNRKLYNTQSKRFITLEEIEELIKRQKEIKVIDNDTENDITATTLSQIIFGLKKNQTCVLPIQLLVSLVQSGGKRMDEIRRNISNSMNMAHHFDVEIKRRVNLLISNGEFSQEAGTQILQKLLLVGDKQEDFRDNFEEKFMEFFRERQIPSKSDFQTLINRIDIISKKVECFKLEKPDEIDTGKGGQIIE